MKHYAYNSPFKMVDAEGVKYTLEVVQDSCPTNPRDWDNLCTMICWHRHYSLGDKHDFDDADEFLERLCYEVLHKDDDELDGLSTQDKLKMLKESNLILIKEINLYDHSGITVSISNGYPYSDYWDAGIVGFIYVTKKKILEETGHATEETWKDVAEDFIEAEMETYDQYVRGDVYGYKLTKTVVEQEVCPHCGEVIRDREVEEDVEGCWGFYGDEIEANGILDYLGDLKFVED